MPNSKKTYFSIWAQSLNRVIGANGVIPWRLSDDFKHFKRVTERSIVIMGRKTFESLPNGALPNRVNIVISRSKSFQPENVLVVGSFDKAVALAEMLPIHKVCFIGGQTIYEHAMSISDCLVVTHVHTHVSEHIRDNTDLTYAPEIYLSQWKANKDSEFIQKSDKNDFDASIVYYERIKEVVNEDTREYTADERAEIEEQEHKKYD